jgi:hypothetical protein
MSVVLDTGVVLDGLGDWESGVIVEVDDERLKVLARGAKCVSFNSAIERQQRIQLLNARNDVLLVSFQDISMIAGVCQV